jgi:site-specific DNA-methyltransferase (cytosine-N4-specific)
MIRRKRWFMAQDCFYYNPAKLPMPAEWVAVRKIRTTDAVSHIFWLSPTPWPQADITQARKNYSKSYLKNVEKNCDDKYISPAGHRKDWGKMIQKRPSGHSLNNDTIFSGTEGSLPPNVISCSHTNSNGSYQQYCRLRKLVPHSARFPPQLPEFFIKILTKPGQFVVDPFGGSCTTGFVADCLDRRWLCIDLNKDFLEGGRGHWPESLALAKGERSWLPSIIEAANS